MSNFAKTPQPPYYAVIFSSQRTEGDHGYDSMAENMVTLVSKQPGFWVRKVSGIRLVSG